MSVEAENIESYSFSHVGKVREDNQDAIRLSDPNDQYTAAYGHLFAIADGMGGYAHGGVASTLALSTFFETFYDANGAAIQQKLKLGVQNANLSVYQTSQRLGAGRMGTTLTVANLSGHTLHFAHVGDSRAYLIRGNKTQCLTNDHTRVGELVRMRLLAPEKIRTHGQRSVLNKCLGLNLFIQPDIFDVHVHNEDRLIFCTDGVWSVIEDEEFGQLASTIHDPEQLTQRIIDLAFERNTDDNVSMITVFLHQLPQIKNPVKMRSRILTRLFHHSSDEEK
ncbi:MAG TPA: protein phosphatase 2C domain-containing protein [Bacteroidota bacterium]|nr:protein phosphatase 2C domain-containing protein [Bacteroidota bacterium]